MVVLAKKHFSAVHRSRMALCVIRRDATFPVAIGCTADKQGSLPDDRLSAFDSQSEQIAAECGLEGA